MSFVYVSFCYLHVDEYKIFGSMLPFSDEAE